LTVNYQKEAFCQAYVRAVASVAGYGVSKPEQDLISVDIIFHSQKGRLIPINAQLKASSDYSIIKSGELHFPLPMKNYNDLRNADLPSILIVLILPDGFDDCPEKWIKQTSDNLVLMKCAYWMGLNGMPESENEASKTIRIPMDDEHIFAAKTLDKITQEYIQAQSRKEN